MNCGKLTPLRGLLILLAIWLVIPGTREARADDDRYSNDTQWQEKVRKLKAEDKDVIIMRSKSMKPEKSPEEFLKRYKIVREQAGKNFTFQTFVEDISRGLVVEQRYHITKGILYNAKENLNPNYHWEKRTLLYNCDKFCITPKLLRKVFGKETRMLQFEGKTKKVFLYEIDMRFYVDYMPGINKECVKTSSFNLNLFRTLEFNNR